MALVKIAEILYIKYIIETSYFKKLDLSFLYYFTFILSNVSSVHLKFEIKRKSYSCKYVLDASEER